MGIQMKQKELTTTFMLISNWKKSSGLRGLNKNISALQWLKTICDASSYGELMTRFSQKMFTIKNSSFFTSQLS